MLSVSPVFRMTEVSREDYTQHATFDRNKNSTNYCHSPETAQHNLCYCIVVMLIRPVQYAYKNILCSKKKWYTKLDR